MAVTEAPGGSEPRRTSRVDRQVLAFLALLLAIVAVYQCRQADPDLWAHLCYGRFFAEHGLRTTDEPFAYTSTGCEWHAQEWLAQWLLWQSYALAGTIGLLVLKGLLGGAAVWCLYRLLRLGSADARIWAPLLMLTAGMLGRWYLFRPQLFTYWFLAYTLLVLFGHLLGRSRRLWTLPPLLALWANLHSGFLAGLGAMGLVLALRGLQACNRAGRRPRAILAAVWPLGLTLLASTVATLLTSFGLGLWRYVLTEMTHTTNRELVDEWMPLLRFEQHGWTVVTVLLLLGVLLFAATMAQVRVRLVAGVQPWAWVLACLPLTGMAFGSIRHVPVLTILVAPVAALLAQAAADAWGEARPWRTGWLAVTGLIAVPTLLTFYFVALHPKPRIRTERYPYGAVAYLRDHHLHGNVYTPLEWGSFLSWELYPEVRVSMDCRNVTLFPSALVRETLVFYLAEGGDGGVPLRYPTDYLLVPQYAQVLPALREDSRWRLLYEDDRAVLFAPAESSPRLTRPQSEKR